MSILGSQPISRLFSCLTKILLSSHLNTTVTVPTYVNVPGCW